MRLKQDQSLIINTNGLRVYPEKYTIADKEQSSEIVLHYKDNTEMKISNRGIGYIGYHCLKFLSENINSEPLQIIENKAS